MPSKDVLGGLMSGVSNRRDLLLPAMILAGAAGLLFYNALRFAMPIASAGLYAQAARQIAESNFQLPQQIHFYGPGDVPFAYPPLAFYVMALFLKLGVSDIIYLRFVPPVLTLASLLGIYLLAKRLTGSSYAAAAALAICAVSPSLYGAHAWSSGAVRAMAFLFMLCALIIWDMAAARKGRLFPALAGVLFGLVALTHLFYALFLALWLGCWILAHPRWPVIRRGLVCVVTASLIAGPWLLVMISRYGTAPLMHAFVSHDNAALADVLSGAQSLYVWIAGHLGEITAAPLEVPLVALGILGALRTRRPEVPLAFVVASLALSPEGERFLVLLAAILIGLGGVLLADRLRGFRWGAAAAWLSVGLVIANAAWSGLPAIQNDLYQARDGTMEVSRYVESNTAAEARYVLLAQPRDGEWLPYLMQRAPFASKWGAEWLGTYQAQIDLLDSIDHCRRMRVVECLADLHLPFRPGDFLVTLKADGDVTRGLKGQPACAEMNRSGAFIVWKADCLTLPLIGFNAE